MINFTAHFVKRKRQKQEKAKQMVILCTSRQIQEMAINLPRKGGKGVSHIRGHQYQRKQMLASNTTMCHQFFFDADKKLINCV